MVRQSAREGGGIETPEPAPIAGKSGREGEDQSNLPASPSPQPLETKAMTTEKITRRLVLAASAAIAAPAVALSATEADADRFIIAAEAEIARIYDWIDRQPNETREQEDARQPAFDRVYQFEDFIAAAEPITAAGAAAKLRRLLDAEVGIVTGASDGDYPSMLRILAFLQSVAGAPTHPTRPVWQEQEEGSVS